MTKVQLSELLEKIVKASLDEDVTSSIVDVMDFDEMADAFLVEYWKTDHNDIPQDVGIFLAGAEVEDEYRVALVNRQEGTGQPIDAESGVPIHSASHFATLLPLP